MMHVELAREVGVVEIEPIDAAAIGAVHDRIELPAQAEVERQLRRRRPPVAEVQRVLPLARGHQLVLHALVGLPDLPEQERRVGVVEVAVWPPRSPVVFGS